MPVRRSRSALLAVLALVGIVAAVTVLIRPAAVRAAPEEAPPEAGVQVEGIGKAAGSPDVLRVTIGVETTAGAVTDAVQGASAAAGRVLEAVHAEGVSTDDVRTVNVSVYPTYGDNGQEITGYTARHDLEVTLRDLSRAGTAIGNLVDAGGDAARLQGVAFSLEDDAALQEAARAEAFAAAREKAGQYAELIGRELGEVVEIREQVMPAGPVPYAMADAAGSAEAVPIQPGTSTVAVTVQVRWSLR
jgi:uncharacterized protein YggE